MSLFSHGIYKMFGQLNPFRGLIDWSNSWDPNTQFLFLMLLALILTKEFLLALKLSVAGVGLGAITGMVFREAVSDKLGEAETSQILGYLILLAGPVVCVGGLLFSFSAFLAAENRGFGEDWLPVVMILGVVVGIVFAGWYQRRRIRRLGEEKANGILFLFGLLVSNVFIAVMVLVSVTSLVYIAWQRVGGL